MIFNIAKSLVLWAVLALSINPVSVHGALEWEDDWNDGWDADDCWPKESPAVPDPKCPGRMTPKTKLDFKNAILKENKLHKGGVMKFEKIGKVKGVDVDMIISVVEGTEYKSQKAYKKNGKSGDFGQINLYTIKSNHESGKGSFQFCLHDHNTGIKKTAESFRFSVFDVDERNGAANGIKERIVFNSTQAEDYFLYPSLDKSELRAWCTSGNDAPCGPDDPMIIHSSTHGDKKDNPSKVASLTSKQKKRSVVFYFKDTDCFEMSYHHYCEIEEEQKGKKCSWYGGGNFFFAGDVTEIVDDGVCVSTKEEEEKPTSPPTVSPTKKPTNPPTPSPTSLPTQSPTEKTCFGKEKMETELDFDEAKLTQNDLQHGGIMKFENIGIVRDKDVDLIVSVVPGTTYESERADLRNGLNGEFGNINLYTELGDLESGQGNFRFCFHDHDSQKLVKVDSFVWSVYDVDERNAAPDGIKEKMIMDLSQASNYMLYPNTDESEIKVSCEDTEETPPCQNSRTVFHSSTHGVGKDNPSDPNNLTEQQKKRSIVYAFENTDCWDITYEHYCRIEEYNGGKCKWYGGGNFLFAGSANQIIESGECYTNAPTQQPDPTPFPTKYPTLAPTGVPSDAPTDAPTGAPTDAPTTNAPTGAPTDAPTTVAPTVAPTDAPTTDAPTTDAPTTDAPTTNAPTVAPTDAPTTDAPTVAPTDAPTDAPTTNAPTGAPTDAPTTDAPTGAPTDSPTNPPFTLPPKDTLAPIDTRGEESEEDDFFIPPQCPSDIKVVKTVGVTEFPSIDLFPTVEIVSKNVDDNTVTVALNQAFGRNPSIDSIYYRWTPDFFSEKCIQETNVAKGDQYAEITIQCAVLKPFATVSICLAEPLEKQFLQPEDNATIPKCCHKGEEEETPVVCYTVEIQCTPGCADEDTLPGRRQLRGSNE